MKIYGMEKLSLVDYDGYTSCTLFTGSCNFRCPFCHNSSLVLDASKQKVLDNDEIFDFLKKRFGLLEAVTISGGEPTLQADLSNTIEKIKAIGYKVKLDTNGTNPSLMQSLINDKLIDYVAMDIKNSKENYAKTVGLDVINLQSIEKSVEILLEGKIDYEFRTTLIKQYHFENDIISIGKWIKSAKRYFLQSFEDRGTNIIGGLQKVDEETAKKYVTLLEPFVPTKLRGY